LPNAVLEAFAAGVPVVATAVGGVPEVVEDGASGFLVPRGDAAALADRMALALAAEDRLRDMGLHGRGRVIEDFGFAAQARQYRRLFEELTAERPPEPPAKEAPPPAAADSPAPDEDDDLISTGPTCRS
jgi:glycosyltransferase involved in cell wall biosynthesis